MARINYIDYSEEKNSVLILIKSDFKSQSFGICGEIEMKTAKKKKKKN